MTDRWTTEDIARELHLTRDNVRQKLRRWRLAGVEFDVKIDPLTGVKRYLPEEILAAHAASPGQGWRHRTDLQEKP